MNEIGYAALLLAFVSTGYGTVASIVGARTGRWEYVKSAERAVYAYCASVSVAGFALFYALLSSDFSNEYVYQYTSLDLSLIHISEPTRRTPISYAVFCLKKKKKKQPKNHSKSMTHT